MVVSYGGHGGTRAADQIKTVLTGIGMRVVPSTVSMAFPSSEFLVKAVAGEDLGLDATKGDGPWAEHRAALREVFWVETIGRKLVPTVDLTNETMGTRKEEK